MTTSRGCFMFAQYFTPRLLKNHSKRGLEGNELLLPTQRLAKWFLRAFFIL